MLMATDEQLHEPSAIEPFVAVVEHDYEGVQHALHTLRRRRALCKPADRVGRFGQLHHVLSDIVGVNGTELLVAIVSGERDPFKLANLCNRRIRSPRQTVAKSLEGDYRPEHLFALRQSLAAYRIYKR